MAECDDPRCPGWILDAEKGEIQRCDQCAQFEDDSAACEHVQKIWDRELQLKYQEYPEHVRVDGRRNMMLCTRCGQYEEMFVGNSKDFASGFLSFVYRHMYCSAGIYLDLDDDEWCELANALESKAQRIERGDYGGEEENPGDNKKWVDTLMRAYRKVTAELDKKGVTY